MVNRKSHRLADASPPLPGNCTKLSTNQPCNDTRAHGAAKEETPKPGGHSLMAPPGPIPNPEVKHQHVDGSRTTGPARVDSRQG